MAEEDENYRGRDFKRSMATLEFLKGQMEVLRGQRQTLSSILVEYERSLEVIRTMLEGSSSEVMLPIGGSVFIKAMMSDSNMLLVEQGAGVFIEMGSEAAIEKIEERRGKIGESLIVLDKNSEELIKRYNEIASETQSIYNSQLSQGDGPENSF